ncbi:hypothetical protein B0I73DRAFT_127664 [Yarrowia lipolytica]|nr:hypothetical protein B0I73DRAFT_127664 [Yarrowia lipolytica]RDW48063.1 hypothetical protein B0I74DRAFT_134266 [Yarrowia lipolytica]RDW55149.1 hypothetical protein B0I75DRAFT_133417 [Yarrowia lipolytica]
MSAPPVAKEDTNPVQELARTPYPAWIMSGLLLATLPYAKNTVKPTKLSCAGFGLVFAAGGYMMLDDITNGAGFTSAWSMLYLLANGTRSVTVFRKPWPLLLSCLAVSNAGLYGATFFFPKKHEVPPKKF